MVPQTTRTFVSKRGDMRKNFIPPVATLSLVAAVVLAASFTVAAPPAPGPTGYHLAKTLPIGGDTGWDYATVDATNRRVYISHGTHVVVLDADSFATVGDIDGLQGIHGIAIADDVGHGFISDGRANNVVVFDLKSLSKLATVPTGTNPDAIIYDPATKHVFAFNGRSKDATVINVADNSVAGTIPVGGKPEFAAADGRGSVYLNIEDTSEVLHIDAKELKVLHRWSIKPCEEPSGLAMDTASRRLFAGCGNKMVAVVNADSGKLIAQPAIGEGVDANAFDPGTKYALSSNGEGTLTVIHEDSPDKFSVAENVPTKRSARTMALDTKTHNVFLPAAEFEPPAPGERRGKIKPGSFVVLVLSR
jgi:YVTN family beta-propeller protein